MARPTSAEDILAKHDTLCDNDRSGNTADRHHLVMLRIVITLSTAEAYDSG